MWNGFLSDNVKFTKVKDHSTADTTDVNSSSVDMQGYNNVVFFTSVGTAATNNLIKVQSSSDDGSADAFADLTETGTDPAASDEDHITDVIRPRERYVRAVVVRGTSTTCESIWCIQYGAREVPITQTVTGTITSKQTNSPAEGTA